MAVLEWDQVGERLYQSGIAKGALYLMDGTVVPWNGLTSVEDATNADLKSWYLDGVKILDHVTPGDFAGKLTAFTYPEEFDKVLGNLPIHTGLTFHEQKAKKFNLSYQTKLGSDLDEDLGYKIHLLYNLLATTDSQKFETIKDQGAATEFSWSLSGTPPISTIDGIRPTVHVSIDSTNARSDILENLENILYGTDTTNPRFPTLLEIRIMFGEVGGLFIIDNGDGTWTAIDPSDDFIDMLDAETFRIRFAYATYLDPPDNTTYQISDTPYPQT